MRNAWIPIFMFISLHCHDAECFYPGSSLVSKGLYLYQSYIPRAKSIAVKPVQHATIFGRSVHFTSTFKQSAFILSCSNTIDAEDHLSEQETYTDEEIEELVAKTEQLWAEAYDARKLADELSDQVEKLAGEIENKVTINFFCSCCGVKWSNSNTNPSTVFSFVRWPSKSKL
jgi:hypothetical protein